MIPVFYDARQSAAGNVSFSPSAGKPAAAVADWLARGLSVGVAAVVPAQRTDLLLAHAPDYVDGVLAGEVPNGFGNTLSEVAQTLPWTVGSLVSATQHVLERGGVACSPTSGFHHAHFAHGGGFCTFNGLIVAARKAAEQWGCDRVLIVDEDQHFSDGCYGISEELGLGWLHIHTLGASRNIGDGCLIELENSLDRFIGKVDLVIYQAGADCHFNDPLGGVYNTAQMAARDRMVFDTCKDAGVPLVWNLAGGYQRDENGGIEPVLALHRQTMEICAQVYCDGYSA